MKQQVEKKQNYVIRWTTPVSPKEDHLPDWARRDNKVRKGDRVEGLHKSQLWVE